MRAISFTLDTVGERYIFGHEDVGFNPGGSGVSGQGTGGIASGRNRQLVQSVSLGHGDGQAQPTGFEAAGWV